MATPYDAVDAATWLFSEPSSDQKTFRAKIFEGARRTPPKVQLCTDDDPLLFVESVSDAGISLRVAHERLALALQRWDERALEMATQHCRAWFKKELQPAQVASLLQPCAEKAQGSWLLHLRGGDVNVWSLLPDGGGAYEPAPAEALVPGAAIWACAEVVELQFHPRRFGLRLALTDALLVPPPRSRAFPFSSKALAFRLEAPPPSEEPVCEEV